MKAITLLAFIGLATPTQANSLGRAFKEVKFDRYKLIKADTIDEIEAMEEAYMAQENAHSLDAE
jgi:hypothetical protein